MTRKPRWKSPIETSHFIFRITQTNQSNKLFVFIVKKLMLRILCPRSDTTVNTVRASPGYTSPNDCPSGLLGSPRGTEQQDASGERYIEEETHRTWLTWLRRQGSLIVCHVRDGAWGTLVLWFHLILRAWESGSNGESPSLGLHAWEPEAWISQGRRWMSRVKQRDWTCPSPAFLLYLVSWMDWMMPTLGRMICFTRFAESNPSLFWKHPHRHTQK